MKVRGVLVVLMVMVVLKGVVVVVVVVVVEVMFFGGGRAGSMGCNWGIDWDGCMNCYFLLTFVCCF